MKKFLIGVFFLMPGMYGSMAISTDQNTRGSLENPIQVHSMPELAKVCGAYGSQRHIFIHTQRLFPHEKLQNCLEGMIKGCQAYCFYEACAHNPQTRTLCVNYCPRTQGLICIGQVQGPKNAAMVALKKYKKQLSDAQRQLESLKLQEQSVSEVYTMQQQINKVEADSLEKQKKIQAKEGSLSKEPLTKKIEKIEKKIKDLQDQTKESNDSQSTE